MSLYYICKSRNDKVVVGFFLGEAQLSKLKLSVAKKKKIYRAIKWT